MFHSMLTAYESVYRAVLFNKKRLIKLTLMLRNTMLNISSNLSHILINYGDNHPFNVYFMTDETMYF